MSGATRSGASDRALAVLLAAFVFVTADFVNLFPRFRNPNEFSRYDLIVSMAERGSFSIGPELARFGDQEDKAVFAGRFYSNKAPGLAFAALPFYFVFRLFLGPARPDHFTAMFYFLRLATVSALSWIALWVFSRRVKRQCADPAWAAVIVLAVAFGTPFLIYARTFFSHAWTASLLYLSFECLHREREKPEWVLMAGLLSGWAVISEYPAALCAALLLLDVGWRQPRRGIFFLLGALPAAALLCFYDASCFGGVLELSSRHEASPAYVGLTHARFVGIGIPSAATALRFLFSPSRGVLFSSPFFFFLPVALLSRKLPRRGLAVSMSITMVLFVAMCGYENWHGGWGIGPRYLLPALFFAAWPLAGLADPEASVGRKYVFAALAAFATIFFFFTGSSFWAMPAEPVLGVRFFSAFWLSRGWLAPTLFGDSWRSLLVPFLVTACAAGAAVFSLFGSRLRAMTALFAGALLFALIFAGREPAATYQDKLIRAVILDSSSNADPAGAELRQLAGQAQTPEDRAQWLRAARRIYGPGFVR